MGRRERGNRKGKRRRGWICTAIRHNLAKNFIKEVYVCLCEWVGGWGGGEKNGGDGRCVCVCVVDVGGEDKEREEAG